MIFTCSLTTQQGLYLKWFCWISWLGIACASTLFCMCFTILKIMKKKQTSHPRQVSFNVPARDPSSMKQGRTNLQFSTTMQAAGNSWIFYTNLSEIVSSLCYYHFYPWSILRYERPPSTWAHLASLCTHSLPDVAHIIYTTQQCAQHLCLMLNTTDQR